MVYKVRIRRQENQKSDSYWQEFEFGGSENSSIAAVLNELNSRSPLTDGWLLPTSVLLPCRNKQNILSVKPF